MEDGTLSSQTKVGVRNRFQQIVLVKKPAKHTKIVKSGEQSVEII